MFKTPPTNKMNCQKCGKWFKEDDLLITPQGSFCEDCHIDQLT